MSQWLCQQTQRSSRGSRPLADIMPVSGRKLGPHRVLMSRGPQEQTRGGTKMSYMFEVYDKAPADPKKEAALSQQVLKHGGRLDYRKDPEETGSSRAVKTQVG